MWLWVLHFDFDSGFINFFPLFSFSSISIMFLLLNPLRKFLREKLVNSHLVASNIYVQDMIPSTWTDMVLQAHMGTRILSLQLHRLLDFSQFIWSLNASNTILLFGSKIQKLGRLDARKQVTMEYFYLSNSITGTIKATWSLQFWKFENFILIEYSWLLTAASKRANGDIFARAWWQTVPSRSNKSLHETSYSVSVCLRQQTLTTKWQRFNCSLFQHLFRCQLPSFTNTTICLQTYNLLLYLITTYKTTTSLVKEKTLELYSIVDILPVN